MRRPAAQPRQGRLAPSDLRSLVARTGLGLVLCYFGYGELTDPHAWAGYIPPLLAALPAVAMILAHGWILFVLGGFVLLGIYTRHSAALGALMLLTILVTLAMRGGVTSIFVRDLGLMALAASLALERGTALSVDAIASRRLPASGDSQTR